ncbi:hypothetical protein MUP37_03830 [Candidatus Bathyarchaeota archaeon]|nr:hypothetical protein [Candidatus Bathyarchaeota archaeon]
MKRTEVRTWGRSRPDLWEVRGIREREDGYRLTGKKVVKILLHARDGSIGESVEDDVENSEWWKRQLGKTFHFDDVFKTQGDPGNELTDLLWSARLIISLVMASLSSRR